MPRHLKLLLAAAITCALSAFFFAEPSHAAARFWVPIAVTGAADNGSGLCRLTVGTGLATGKVTGETVTVASVTGATGCNVTTTITAIDSTHIDLVGTTFGGAYVSGGTISGGTWNATNIGNWGTGSGTGSGAAVPTSADACTLDGASGGGTVTGGAAYSPACGVVTAGAFTGTIDFSANNNSPTFTSFSFTGTGSGRSLLCGTGNWTLTTVSGAPFDNTNITSEGTFTCNTGTITLSATATSSRTFASGGKTFNNFTVSNPASNSYFVGITQTGTFSGNVTLTNVRWFEIQSGVTLTIGGTFSYTGADSTHPVLLTHSGASGVGTLSIANAWAPQWIMFSNITKAGAGSMAGTINCFDGGNNSGITCVAPNVVAGGGGTSVIGGGL